MAKAILNSKVRTDILNTLTARSVAHHASGIAEKLASINDGFWERHMTRVRSIIPGLAQAEWQEAIWAGTVVGCTRKCPDWLEVAQHNTRRVPIVQLRYGGGMERVATLNCVLHIKPFAGVGKYLQQGYREYVLWTYVEGAVPDYTDSSTLPPEHPLVVAGQAVQEQLEDVIKAALAFRGQLETVLWGCRTPAQLQAVLPEAYALLPTQGDRKMPLPVELGRNISQMLETGVPPVTEAA